MQAYTDYRKYLIPSVVAKLSNIELKAKLVVEGFMTGLHKSPYHGFSVEFAEHRPYMPGDDLRYLDWKIIARTDRYYIKQFEEETNLKSYVLLDISKSMDFTSANDKTLKPAQASGSFLKKFFSSKASSEPSPTGAANLTKLEYGSYLAASLSYLMLMQKDAISLTTYDTQVRKYIPPHATNTNLRYILKELSGVRSNNETGTARSLNEIANKVKRRGLVIVISDLFDDKEQVMSALKHFKYNKNEVIVFQVLDPVEMTFLEGSPVTLIDSETKEEMYSQPYAMQKAYQDAVKDFIEGYRTECSRNNIDYVLLSTETPFDKALLGYLNKRSKVR